MKNIKEGLGISKTNKNGINSKTKNFKERSLDFVRESEEDNVYYIESVESEQMIATFKDFDKELIRKSIVDHLKANPSDLVEYGKNNNPVDYYEVNKKSGKVSKITQKRGHGNIKMYKDIEEGGGISLTNKKGTNAKPSNLKKKKKSTKKLSEAELKSYIEGKVKKLEKLYEIQLKKKD